MTITLSDQQMLELWREGARLEPALHEATIEVFDGRDADRFLLTAMRAWYIRYLTTAPIETVWESDLTEYARLTRGPGDDQWTLELQCDTARITGIAIEGMGSVEMLDPERAEDREKIERLKNKFTRHGPQPTAYHHRGTNRAILNIKSDEPPKVKEVRGVEITEDNVFRVDERVLNEIPELARKAIADELN